jgi:hypothetical protein
MIEKWIMGIIKDIILDALGNLTLFQLPGFQMSKAPKVAQKCQSVSKSSPWPMDLQFTVEALIHKVCQSLPNFDKPLNRHDMVRDLSADQRACYVNVVKCN